MKKVLIVGAGLFGATVANLLSKSYDVTVIDKAKEIGGSCATEVISGIHVHKYGPHIFHTNNQKVWKFVNQFDDFKVFYNEPLANYYGKIYHLPFNMNTFERMFGAYTPDLAESRIKTDRKNFPEPKNLEEYALATVGETIYETLIKHYTEKQWGKKCIDLPADFIKRLPLRFTYNNHYFDDTYQGIPMNGYSYVIDKMLQNSLVQLNIEFEKYMEDNYDLVIYSGSIDEYYDYCFGKLEYRSLLFSHQVLPTSNYQGVAVMNYTGVEPMTRITEHKHFLNEASNYTVITYEVPCKWNEFNERYYPIQTKENQEIYESYAKVENNKVIFGGRLGSYKYLNMDKVIEQAFETAKLAKSKLL